MHTSASETLIAGLIEGKVDPSEVKCMISISFGTILKPGSNLVALYQLVAGLNKETYIQIDYQVKTMYWHDFLTEYYCIYSINYVRIGWSERHIHVVHSIIWCQNQ